LDGGARQRPHLNIMLTSYLDSKFRGCKQVPLGALIHKVRSGEVIPAGSLVLTATGDRRLKLRKTPKELVHKNFNEPILPNEFAAEHKVTQAYLSWYLAQDEVANYLVDNSTGVMIVRVPRKFLHAVPVPLPASVKRIKTLMEFSVVKTNNRFSKIIGELHSDYLLNVSNSRYRTATVLAAAICEVILYELLIEHGVNPKLLKDDHGLGMNKMLDYIRVLKIDATPGFPISQLEELRKNRNGAVHAGLLVNTDRELTEQDLQAFNPVIRYFGL
jgi:hypothetical protein